VNGGQGGSGTAGSPGDITVKSGITCGEIQMRDGSGTAPTTTRTLYLGGNCIIGTLSMTNRIGCIIKPYAPTSYYPVTLKLGRFEAGYKQFLRNPDGTDTTSPLTVTDRLFMAIGGSGKWTYVAGTVA
jgi:hypothetical protein